MESQHKFYTDVRFGMNVAGRVHRLPETEIAKCLPEKTYQRDILEISDRIKRVESRKDFSKDRKDIPIAVSNFKKRGENSFSVGASRNRGVQLRVSRTSRMKKVLSATIKDIMQIRPESKAKDTKLAFKVRKIDEFGPKNGSEAKSVRQIRYQG